MRQGTRSLLFGVHQFLWHPLTVWLAWRRYYGACPNWRETICIIVHDWGYWGSRCMDDHYGEHHPERSARFVRWLGPEAVYLVTYHSRYLSARHGVEPSRLCWPDKLSFIYEPRWWYLLRARATGELWEYIRAAVAGGHVPPNATPEQWFDWCSAKMAAVAVSQEHGKVRHH